MSARIIPERLEGSFSHQLSDLTNRPDRNASSQTKHGHPLSRSAISSNYRHSNGQIDISHKREHGKALLDKDWRKRSTSYAGPRPLPLSHVKTTIKHVSRPKPNETGKCKQIGGQVNTTTPSSNGTCGQSQSQEPASIGFSFNITHDDSEDGSKEDGKSQKNSGPLDKKVLKKLLLGPKHFLKMDSLMSPASHSRHVPAPPNLIDFSPVRNTGSSPTSRNCHGLANLSEYNLGSSTSDAFSEQEMKPTVCIQKVNNLRSLNAMSWDALGDYIQIQSSGSEQHDQLQTLDNIQTGRAAQQRARQPTSHESDSTKYNPQVNKEKSALIISSGSSIKKTNGHTDEDRRFQAMLEKLHKRSVQAIQTGRSESNSVSVPDTSKMNLAINGTHDCVDGKFGRSFHSHDTFGDLQSRRHALNPKATEFSFCLNQKGSNFAYQTASPTKFQRAPLVGLIDKSMSETTQPKLNDQTMQCLYDVRIRGGDKVHLDERVRRIVRSAQLLQFVEQILSNPLTQAERQAILELIDVEGLANLTVPNMMPHSIVNPDLPTGQTATQSAYACPSIPGDSVGTATPSMSSGPYTSLPAMTQIPPLSGFYNNNNNTSLFKPSYATVQSDLMRPDSRGIHMMPINPVTRPASNNRPARSSSIEETFRTISSAASMTHFDPQAVNVYNDSSVQFVRDGQSNLIPMGPKPVLKPKGPPRPHDPNWCKQQLDYEAYLEYRRMLNPEYHRECRERQAQRADRKRRDEMEIQFKRPEKKNAAIEIKKPS